MCCGDVLEGQRSVQGKRVCAGRVRFEWTKPCWKSRRQRTHDDLPQPAAHGGAVLGFLAAAAPPRQAAPQPRAAAGAPGSHCPLQQLDPITKQLQIYKRSMRDLSIFKPTYTSSRNLCVPIPKICRSTLPGHIALKRRPSQGATDTNSCCIRCLKSKVGLTCDSTMRVLALACRHAERTRCRACSAGGLPWMHLSQDPSVKGLQTQKERVCILSIAARKRECNSHSAINKQLCKVRMHRG